MNAKTRAAIDGQLATMKRNEEAAGLWCVCGHSRPTHDVGFTCQSVACNCLNFRPSTSVKEHHEQVLLQVRDLLEDIQGDERLSDTVFEDRIESALREIESALQR